MFLTTREQEIVDRVKTLSAEAKKEAIKAWGFFHRFMWPSIVAAFVAGVVLGNHLGR